jgi:hypothetical protein
LVGIGRPYGAVVGQADRGVSVCGRGVNWCLTAAERATKIRVAGDEQTASRGSSVSVGDSGQSPEAMSLSVWTTIDVSLVVS